MAEFTPEKIEQFKLLIRRAIIREPSFSGRSAGKMLSIDKNVAVRLTKEVRAEGNKILKKEIENLKKKTVEEDLTEINQKFEEMIRELWQIISDRDSRKIDRMRAINELRDTIKVFFNMKMDAGIFTRKFGELTLIDMFRKISKEDNEERRKHKGLDSGKTKETD